MKFFNVPEKGDPSNIPQNFSGLNIQLLCCRYWWLKSWESSNMSFPYWRIYWNPTNGAHITFDNETHELEPGKIYLIPPNTSFSSNLKDRKVPKTGYMLEGGRVGEGKTEQELINEGIALHLFIHFNLGMPYDFISTEIFSFEVTPHIKEKLDQITDYVKVEAERFNFYSSLVIYSLICDLISEIPENRWNLASADYRVLEVLKQVEQNLGGDLSNNKLAEVAKMATNAFTRLFTEEIGISPQRFVKKRRIDKACMMLHHSNFTIDQVALETGFADRFHFSRIFKQITGFSPAAYKKGFVFK